MEIYKTYQDAAIYAGAKVSHKRWTDRIADMLRHVCTTAASDNSTPMSLHRVKIERVAKSWPLSGSITVRRDDGVKFALTMSRKNGFTIKQATA